MYLQCGVWGFFLLGFIPRFHCKLFCEFVHLYMYMEDGMCYIRLLLYWVFPLVKLPLIENVILGVRIGCYICASL